MRESLARACIRFFVQIPMGVNSAIELTHSEFSTHKDVLALPKLKTSAKSVQTTRVVSSNFSRSLYRLQLKSPESTTY